MLNNKFIKEKFLNQMVIKGQKQTSEKAFLKCLKLIQKSVLKRNFKEIFKISLVNASPFFQLKTIKKKKNKNVIEIPFLLKKEFRLFYSIKNIIKSSNITRNNSFYKNIHSELIKASNLTGTVIKKKKNLHENAFKKKKYARYRWF